MSESLKILLENAAVIVEDVRFFRLKLISLLSLCLRWYFYSSYVWFQLQDQIYPVHSPCHFLEIYMGNRRYRETLRLQKQYGDIFRLYIGKQMMVTICGYENIHDAFVKHAAVLSNRPEGLFKSQTKYGNLGKA